MSNIPILTGTWTNWSKGPILGATLTTASAQGFLLVSFLTLFVSMSGDHLWSILCFIMHQMNSLSTHRDGLFHQQQLLLRNSESDKTTLYDLIKITVSWR